MMSQTVQRPPSKMKTGMAMPEIKHPMSDMKNPDSMDIRGVSRSGGPRPTWSPPLPGRPLAHEEGPNLKKSFSATSRDLKVIDTSTLTCANPSVLQNIPEGTEVKHGDCTTPRLPVFGNRSNLEERTTWSRSSSNVSRTPSQARLELDEIETILKEKLRHNYYDVRKKFKDNDPEGQGNVSREALTRILVTILGRAISGNTCQRLVERLGFADHQIIAFPEFFSYFRDRTESTYPHWMDPVRRASHNRKNMASEQVHAYLKQETRNRFMNLADIIPQFNPGGSARLMKTEFRQMLNNMNFYMSDQEFEKLWLRYEPENEGIINGERLLHALGVEWRSAGTPARNVTQDSADATPRGGRLPRKTELERRHQLNIELWLKNKFREGFFNMRDAFEQRDPDSSGVVTTDDFLQVLGEFGLNMEKNLLGTFLNRCSVKAIDKMVPYREFLHRFQDRRTPDMSRALLDGVNKRNIKYQNNDVTPAVRAVEVQLTNMFQRDFLALLGMFKKLDRLATDVISQEEFRAAIESRFDLQLTDVQFQSFIDGVPLDDEGSVKYVTFMQQFDGRGQAPSLFGPRPDLKDIDNKNVTSVGSGQKVVVAREGHTLPVMSQTCDVDQEREETCQQRSQEQLFQVIKNLLSRQFHEVEERFYELDEFNTRRLTQDRMYSLLTSFDIDPKISRGEICDLWDTFITNSDNTLDYLQFVRHFGFSPRSATFPNAKLQPPRRGDADFMVRSRKFNCDWNILQDSLRAKVDYLWDDLSREFASMDPYKTGCVDKEEFTEVLTELCVSLDNLELKQLADKFQFKNDGRVSYIAFLRPFAVKKQTWPQDNIVDLLQTSQRKRPSCDIGDSTQEGLEGITNKLRQKLSGDWKNLRRAFKKLDVTGNGFLSIPEFRAVLKLANVVLDEEEIYHVMNEYDPDLAGKIKYEQFITETFKPESRQSVRSK